MGVTVSELQARMSVDQSSRAKFKRDMADADRTMGNTSKTGVRAFGALAHAAKYGFLAAGAAVVAGAGYSIKSASDLGESMNAVNVVFGKASKQIFTFGKTAATAAGLSQRAFNEAVTPIGAALRNVGLSANEAAEASIELGQRAADMASVFNVDVSEALTAIQAGLRGEADPLERFGVGLSEAALQSYAVKNGIAEANTELTASQKVQARLGLVMEQTERVAGDFANTSGGLANQQRILRARLENSAAAIGKTLLPMATKLVGYLNDHVIPVIDQFAGFLEGISKKRTTEMKIKFAWEGISGVLEKILFGSPATRIRVPVDQRHFEWQVKGGGSGLVGAVADAIRDIDWVHVGTEIVKGFNSGLKSGIESAGFDPSKGLLPQIWPNAFGWAGADIPKGPSGWDLIKKAFGGLEEDANAATMTVTGFQEKTGSNLRLAGQHIESFAVAAGRDFKRVATDSDHSADMVETLRGQIDKLHSKTVKVTADVSGLSTTAALAEHLALINSNKNIHVSIAGPSGDGLIGVGGVGAGSVSPTLFDDLGLAQAFGLGLSSGYRPGAITSTGNPSLHGVFPSKAIDVSGSESAMAAFFRAEVLRAPFTGIRELIHNPYAWYPGAGLVNISGSALARDHIDHVHVGSYDQGGYLRPGWNLAYNGTGRPEAVGGGVIINVQGSVIAERDLHGLIRRLEDEHRRRGGR